MRMRIGARLHRKISVEFKAKKGYYFGTVDEEMFSFEGDEVTFVSAKVKNNGSGMTLIFTLGSDEDDLSVHGLSWNEEDGFAEWEENDNARVYQVKLYRNDVAVGSTRMTKNTTYDFSEWQLPKVDGIALWCALLEPGLSAERGRRLKSGMCWQMRIRI